MVLCKVLVVLFVESKTYVQHTTPDLNFEMKSVWIPAVGSHKPTAGSQVGSHKSNF